MEIQWVVKPFAELSGLQLYQILQLRIDVFMLEQDCLYRECDDKDLASLHLFGTHNQQIVAYARLLPAGISYSDLSIGRVVVRADYRKYRIGKELMNHAIAYWKSVEPSTPIRISGQLYLQKFYEDLGFEKVSEVYLEDNIPHIEMLKK
ncbi:GNAT family N-acetyltransferase [Sphingobacterium griseoflavum]|uniref:GNAT family acetyltransferase n=1 Tax=Sphingobacterium griseoflavum TaxID=1474952 RepID=A0ABQ3HSQ1_9SPHI|nr:GNAT family N-acetyltransferase [Sphingobacterium griseoflavum]GHE23197.1 GNAT family acetyltransferase [Sphingobacterium griseoflavum]